MALFGTKMRNCLKYLLENQRKNSYKWTNKQLYGTSTYEGDGKTTIHILNNKDDMIMINAYNQFGFRLNNDMQIIGPCVVFPRSVLSWHVGSLNDINEESLSLFMTLEPKIDILVIGIGNEKPTPNVTKYILSFMKNHRINVEVTSTDQACATFNFLNSEYRMVAAALIPPTTIKISENDIMDTHRKKAFYSYDL